MRTKTRSGAGVNAQPLSSISDVKIVKADALRRSKIIDLATRTSTGSDENVRHWWHSVNDAQISCGKRW